MIEHHLTVPRTARYFTLGELSPRVTRVWLVCHGYSQLARDFLKYFLPLNAPHRFIVAPEALSRFYLKGTDGKVGATWMTKEDRLHEIRDYINYLNALHDEIFSSLPGERVRLVVLGFSQGTSTVMRWICRGNVQPDRVILWGGGIPADIDLPSLRSLFPHNPLTIVVGDRDEYIDSSRVEAEKKKLTESGVPYQLITFKGGHRLDAELLQRLAAEVDE